MSLHVYMPDGGEPLTMPIGEEFLALTADQLREALAQNRMLIMRGPDGAWYISGPDEQIALADDDGNRMAITSQTDESATVMHQGWLASWRITRDDEAAWDFLGRPSTEG